MPTILTTSQTVFLLFVLVVTTFTLAATNPDEEVVLVQVAHRHGARTPIVPLGSNPTSATVKQETQQVCGDLGCGMLTHNGKMMLQALGIFLRKRYGDGDTSVLPEKERASAAAPSAAFSVFADKQYHMRQLKTRSTQWLRTMQSADALLRGITDNMTDLYPVVHTVEPMHDTLLSDHTWLSVEIPVELRKNDCMNRIPQSWVKGQALTAADLVKIAKELGFEPDQSGSWMASCKPLSPDTSSFLDYCNCTHPLFGAAACAVAAGKTAAEIPTTLAKYNELSNFLSKWRECAYGNTSAKQGAVAFELYDTMVQNMEQRIKELDTQTAAQQLQKHETLIYEYSAHDTTIAPLSVALGFDNSRHQLPRFGQAVIVELVRNKKTKATSVRYWYGSPSTMKPPAGGATSTPADYPYVFESLSVSCIETVGGSVKKNVTDGSCTLDAISNYAKYHLAPADPAGAACYVSKELLADFNCAQDGITANASTPRSPLCVSYRTMCPGYACKSRDYQGSQYIVALNDGMDLQCVPTAFDYAVSLPVVNGIMFGTVFGGALIGVVVAQVLHLFDGKKREALQSDLAVK